MDYEFLRDITGNILAKFSMGHEVLGHWLNEEINSDIEKLDQIEEMTKQLKGNERQWRWVGHEYTLWLNAEEAIIRANPVDFDSAEFEEGMNYYDQESVCSCGLEDFLAVLKNYRGFILALK